MLTPIERILILSTVDLFHGTPEEILAEVAAALSETVVGAGEVIFQEGDPGDSLYIVVAGDLRVERAGQTLNALGPRSIFGEMALLEDAPRLATVSAVSDALLLRLDAQDFAELLDDRIEIARGIIRVLTGRLRGRLEDLSSARGAAQ